MFQQNLKCYLGFAVCAGEEKKREGEKERKLGLQVEILKICFQ